MTIINALSIYDKTRCCKSFRRKLCFHRSVKSFLTITLFFSKIIGRSTHQLLRKTGSGPTVCGDKFRNINSYDFIYLCNLLIVRRNSKLSNNIYLFFIDIEVALRYRSGQYGIRGKNRFNKYHTL